MPDTEKTEQERIIELARGIPYGWLTTVNGEGRLVARPMSPRDVTDEGEIWYFAERDSRDASEIMDNPNVGVTLNSGSTFVSFAGTAELVDDPAKKEELWDAAVEAWLPDGPHSSNAVLIKVTAESGEYWDTPGGRIATLISFVKAKVTGERYDGGENETVKL
ncbi:pyridoxamine 5'-phosphate oxidase family protein [Agromyces sp. NPDC058110]|uniref:pyridoxamine 5'-phosphate oxidase family protein n=1 Tax=Agromyces sp. NPDC058110 TaxID=3346345 RepID=UPI0036DB761A